MNNLTCTNYKNKAFVLFAGLFLSFNVAQACELTGNDIFNCLDNSEGTKCLKEFIYGKENSKITNNGSVLTVDMPEGSYTYSGFKKGLGTNGGAQIVREIVPREEVYISFTALFNDNFKANKGGKFGIGICSGNCPTGGKKSSEGSSVRLMWRRGNAGELYLYYPEMKSKYGKSFGKRKFFITPGKKQHFELYFKMNDIGERNGIIEVIVDGKKIILVKNFVFRLNEDDKFDKIISSTFFGGGKPKWKALRDSTVEYSDVCIK